MGGGKSDKEKLQESILQQYLDLAKKGDKRADQAFNAISPFGQSLITMGQLAQKGQAPDWMRNIIRAQMAQGFQTGRENLVDFLGDSGQGTSSGLAAGPFANLQAQEAQAYADAEQQAIMQAIGMGFQGANMMS